LSESSATEPALSADASTNEVAVNYTISSPLRKSLRTSVEKDEEEDDQKISATFTISPPPKPNTNSISLFANRLEKSLEQDPEEGENSVSATINVPLIPTKNTTSMDSSDRLKKTDHPSPTSPKLPPVPQPRSLFDLDNASSMKLADKLQQEAKRCEAVGDDMPEQPLPPSPIHHTIFGERRPSWRFKSDYSSKVNSRRTFHVMLLMSHQISSLEVEKFLPFMVSWILFLFSLLFFFTSKHNPCLVH
jgi:hypothetical protein